MADIFVTHERVRTRGELPAELEPGRKYYVEDEGVVVIDWGEGPKEFGGGAGGGGVSPSDPGALLVDALSGNEADRAPSVRAVNEGLATKVSLTAEGKLPEDVLPGSARGDLYYRGAFVDDAALKAAHATDTTGAYATVLSTGTMWIWDGAEWTNTGTPPPPAAWRW